MAGSFSSGDAISSNTDTSGNDYNFALAAMTALFFLWGFITCLNDILIPHLKAVFDLSYAQAMLIQSSFFGAYFLVSMPAGKLVKRYSYQKGVVIGLSIASLGCLAFMAAAEWQNYSYFLGALFILASGITILQVAANPYVTLLGSSKTASSRLNMTQAFNSLGTTIAPFIGGALILSAVATGTEAVVENQAQSLQLPYLSLAIFLALLALIFSKLTLPEIKTEQAKKTDNASSIFQHKHLTLGAIGIFLYVGAEVSIGSFLINFLAESHIAAMTESEAANYVALYWGGAMVGRFIGAAIMQKVAAGRLLMVNSLAAVLLVALAMFNDGAVAMWAVLSVGLCNSIMFPTIFSLAVNQLGEQTSQGSGLLCLAIVGGAIIPLLQGMLADISSLQVAFIIPLLCYLYIAYYGIAGSKCKASCSTQDQLN